ncbi:pilus assembly protein [Arenimonas daejeonensis]|uniref:pilus assembly protein n=1 Tax=Arenimonas daejeonensis TaxID=370777 RepID=UPI0011BEEF29|nr:PilC/PilY family type IV pilus protein [Arenimonas daejeonensis]
MNSHPILRARIKPLAVAAAFVATLFALPVTSVMAQSFPQYPLQTGAGDVEPNIMFILDDSGSMAFDEMPNPDIPSICRRSGSNCTNPAHNITQQAFPGNSVYYNPQTEYDPWLNSTGSPMTGGTTFTSVYASFNHAGPGASGGESDLVNLSDPSSCESYRVNSGSANTTICGGTQTFFAPKNPDPAVHTDAYLANSNNYYRYQIRTVSGSTQFVRSELANSGAAGSVAGPANSNTVRDFNGVDENDTETTTINLTDGWFTAVTSFYSGGGGSGNLRLRVYDVNSGNLVCEADTNNGVAETCTAHGLSSGPFRFELYVANGSGNRDLDNVRLTVTSGGNGCTAPSGGVYSWRGCTIAVPVRFPSSDNRSAADELINYATWFSYHRTRMKIAKAGASAAFNQLGGNVRVGFRSLHENNSNTDYDIPVGDGNNGNFEGTARSDWFGKLFNARGQSGTPLRAALQSTGEYFTQTGASGPYGPAAANQLACRQNFAILTTDGFWNGSLSTSVGNQDGTSGASIINHRLPSTDPNYDAIRYTRAHPYQDGAGTTNYSNTLADVAMKYWKEDLRTDLDNIVPPGADNPAFWQHMVTFGISIGLKGTVDQTSVAQVLQDGRPRINGSNVNWPDPTDTENAERIDDLLHAAVNGHGEFIAATSADRFRDALVGVLGQIQSRLASGSNVATNSTTFQSDTRMYQATYTSGIWTGDLVARDVTEVGGISDTEVWRVSARILATYADGNTSNDYHNRSVFTWNGTAGSSFPTGTQSTALTRATGSAAVTGADNASYIKGARSLEASNGGLLRNRSSVLGDIINSSPFYVRDSETIFVGANDGMLHAINALTGDVRFSYVPAGVNMTALASLSDPAYTHNFFVDGPVAVSGSRVVSGTNYLVGTLGRGGKGVFALNVTAPASMADSGVLWDKTAAVDADMGYVTGLPLIVNGNNDEALAIVPNGIDSTNGSAVLYVYNVATGAQLAKIDTGATGGNGLASPRAADLNADGKVDYVYAGDLQGHIWKFDFTSNVATNWAVALSGQPLFTATDSGGAAQPITGGLALARESTSDEIWVTFGTGKLISSGDLSDTSVQTMYGVIDGDVPVVRADLTVRTIAAVGIDSAGRPARAFETLGTAGRFRWLVCGPRQPDAG